MGISVFGSPFASGFSSIGRASISALRATVAPGLLPSIKRNPLPGEVSVSNPEIPNCSRMDLMRASVPRVLKPTSGFRGRFCGRRSNEIRIVEAPDECFLDLLCFSFSAEIALLNKAHSRKVEADSQEHD